MALLMLTADANFPCYFCLVAGYAVMMAKIAIEVLLKLA